MNILQEYTYHTHNIRKTRIINVARHPGPRHSRGVCEDVKSWGSVVAVAYSIGAQIPHGHTPVHDMTVDDIN